MLEIRFLEKDEIELAQHLLYEVYIVEQNWNIKKGNPSGMKIINSLLVDDFDNRATWVGAFDKGNLVGTNRYIPYPFELSKYKSIPFYLNHKLSLECNRLAFIPAYRIGSPLFVQLLLFGIKSFSERGFQHLFGSCSFPNPGNIYLKLGAKLAENQGFRYDNDDENEVKIVDHDLTDRTSIERTVSLSRKLVSRMAK